ncbi:MAG: hypothetical protein U1F54_19510 [Burkholderiales bacterium]
MTSPHVVFLGSEASAAAFRLAGIDARVAIEGREDAELSRALDGADLVIVEASVAARVPVEQWRDAIVDAPPLVTAIPDLAGTTCIPDLAGRLRRQLGLAEG